MPNKPRGGRRGGKAKKADSTPVDQPLKRTKTKGAQRARGGPKPYDWRPAFLQTLAKRGTHAEAASAAQIDPSTAYRERQSNPSFAKAVAEAEAIGTQALVDEAVRRASHGLVRYRFSKDGKPLFHPETGQPYFELEYSDTLLSLLLKAKHPAFKDKLDVSGDVKHAHLTLEEFDARYKAAGLLE